ncbi:MAG: hypothetical protein IV100_33745 [Myxococcales bacterium]|nr:hypothetical protein [Myxococcales bacterium]
MKTCAYCETRILFGGEGQGELRYCNRDCQRHSAIVEAASRVPEQVVSQQTLEIHRGPCPECNGPGPVDVHTSHRVWSLLMITSWSSYNSLACRPCGIKSILRNLAFSAAAGWWGVPWGLVVTPV